MNNRVLLVSISLMLAILLPSSVFASGHGAYCTGDNYIAYTSMDRRQKGDNYSSSSLQLIMLDPKNGILKKRPIKLYGNAYNIQCDNRTIEIELHKNRHETFRKDQFVIDGSNEAIYSGSEYFAGENAKADKNLCPRANITIPFVFEKGSSFELIHTSEDVFADSQVVQYDESREMLMSLYLCQRFPGSGLQLDFEVKDRRIKLAEKPFLTPVSFEGVERIRMGYKASSLSALLKDIAIIESFIETSTSPDEIMQATYYLSFFRKAVPNRRMNGSSERLYIYYKNNRKYYFYNEIGAEFIYNGEDLIEAAEKFPENEYADEFIYEGYLSSMALGPFESEGQPPHKLDGCWREKARFYEFLQKYKSNEYYGEVLKRLEYQCYLNYKGNINNIVRTQAEREQRLWASSQGADEEDTIFSRKQSEFFSTYQELAKIYIESPKGTNLKPLITIRTILLELDEDADVSHIDDFLEQRREASALSPEPD